MSNVIDEIVKKNKCSGCLACVDICEKKAISYAISEEGFYRPIIDSTLCTGCSKCTSFCKEAKGAKGSKTLKFLSAQTKDNETLLISTSGGFFQEIGKCYIKNGGVVYGSVYDREMNIIISRATTIRSLKEMSGSKYAQSNALGSYSNVLNDLNNKKKVLFSGTPCQISGLLTYLEYKNCDSTNLITIDFPCYGINPIKFFKENINYLNDTIGGKIIDFRFRDKTKNGFSHTTLIKYKKENEIKQLIFDDFRDIPCHMAFGRKNLFQSNCYNCEFIKKSRVSDITIGSFWNFNLISSKYDVTKGVSMVCLNTKKSIECFNKIKNEMVFYEHNADEIYYFNPGLYEKEYKFNSNQIFKFYKKYGFVKTAKKYFSNDCKKEKIHNFKKRVFRKLWSIFSLRR